MTSKQTVSQEQAMVGQTLEGAFNKDPITGLAIIASLFVVVFGFLRRRGGVDAGFVINVFAFFATISSALKALYWAVFGLLADSGLNGPPPPGGTDILLVVGAFTAVLIVSFKGLVSAIEGDSDGISPIGQMIAHYKWAQNRSPFFMNLFGYSKRGKSVSTKPPGEAGEVLTTKPPADDPALDDSTDS